MDSADVTRLHRADTGAIEFERRVLEEARDERNPLLERVKFLGILGRNLDEFMMVRGRRWIRFPSAKRLTRKTHALLREGCRVLQRDLVPALADAGIHLVDYASLTRDERADVDRRFAETVLPLMTPVLCGAAPIADAPGPGLNFAVVIDDPQLVRQRCLSGRFAARLGEGGPVLAI